MRCEIEFAALQIPDSHYEKRNTQNEQLIFLLVTIVKAKIHYTINNI